MTSKERKKTKRKEKIVGESTKDDTQLEVDPIMMLESDVKMPRVVNLKLYFNSDTQAAIVKFQKSTDKKSRDVLYVQDIMPAFEKLVENLINIHKFTGLHDTYEELKNDCVNFLFETIHKFDANRGTNAFSYFNVVAKNWLIIRTKQKAQKIKRNVSLDDPAGLTAHESLIIEEYNVLPSQDFLIDSADSVENTIGMLYDIRSRVKTENELTCINSIITIFENIDEIDLLNKSAVLLYMRELSGLTPKQLTSAMQSIKRHYKKTKIDNRDA
jgi:hypothetical protein